jgi:hypothetical protein
MKNMDNLALFDLAMSDPIAGDADRKQALIADLVGALVTQMHYLREFDGWLAPNEGAGFDRAAAIVLRTAYEQWVKTAGGAIERIERLNKSGLPVPNLSELIHQHGRAMAMLSTSLEDLDRARQQIKDGQTHSREEVLRELGFAPKRRRA